MMQIRNVSDHKKVKNYIHTENKPFTADQVVSFTGVDRRVVVNYLCFMQNQGEIRQVGKQGNKLIYSKKYARRDAGIDFCTLIIFRELYKQKEREMIAWIHANKYLYYARMG